MNQHHEDPLQAAHTRIRRLEVIMEITKELTSTLELEDLLQLILRSAVKILSSGAGSLFLTDAPTGDLVFRVVTSGENELIGTRVPAGKGIIGKAAATGEPVIVTDAASDERFFGQLDHKGFVTQSLLAVPLRISDRTIGVLELINKVDGSKFSPDDASFLTIFAAQAAIAIENARLYREALIKQRMARELEMAYEVQAGLIPAGTPSVPGWEFAASWEPAREVSGDYYDFISSTGRQGVLIADVSGKGMHAALLMAVTRSVVRAMAAISPTPAASLTQANRHVCADSTRGMFVTLFYMEISPATDTVTYVNCGHNPVFWYRADRNDISELAPTNSVLGYNAALECKQAEIAAGHGDVVVLYTDGITEAFNADDLEFGDERFKAVLMAHANESPERILAEIQKAVKAHVGSAPQSDDRTIVIAKRR